MPVDPRALGAELAPNTVEITPRMLLAFAAGVGDLGAPTFDDAGPVPLIASPGFCARLEWAVLGSGRASLLGVEETERLRAVHVEQDTTYHHAILPGSRLITTGRVMGLKETSAGVLVRTLLSTVDADHGRAVVTSWHASIYRGVALAGEGGAIEEPPGVPELKVDAWRDISLPVAREAAHVYSECASIWNPIHSERRVALAQGLPDVILHGTATWAIAGREIVARVAEGDVARLRRLRARFKAFVLPGHAITLQFATESGGLVPFRVLNHLGAVAVEGGLAQLEV
jgi:acyl dehydratase